MTYKKPAKLYMKLHPAMLQALNEVAASRGASRSGLIRLILADWLEANGYPGDYQMMAWGRPPLPPSTTEPDNS
jgi:hypothetical protein